MNPSDSADNPEPHGGPKTSQTSSQQNSISLGVKKLPMDSPANPSSPALVYVRRKVEVDTSKAANNTEIGTATNPNPPKEPSTLTVVTSSPQGPTSRMLDWEERYHHLQMLLNKIHESDRSDHVRMLWSLSSSELSKHAVELEKRSIQFSLEEAREMQRVAALNVLGRSVDSLKSTSNDGEL